MITILEGIEKVLDKDIRNVYNLCMDKITIHNIIEILSIPTILSFLAIFIYIGKKLQVLETVEKTLETVGKTVENIRDRFIIIETKVNTAWENGLAPAHSPRKLNSRGTNILLKSGIKEVNDNNRRMEGIQRRGRKLQWRSLVG